MARLISSRLIAAQLILLVSQGFHWIDAAPSSNDGLQQSPPSSPFGHMGVTTVCVELRPAPHAGGPTQICGPIVPGHFNQDPPQEPPSASTRASIKSDFVQSQQMQQQQQQQQQMQPILTPMPEFMMRSDAQPQQQQQQHLEHPCIENQRVYGQSFLDMVPPPQGFFAAPPPPSYMAKAADGRTFFLAPWGVEPPAAPATFSDPNHEQRAAYDCDSMKTNGFRGFPPRVFNSRTLPLGPVGFAQPPIRQFPFQTPQHMRAVPSVEELIKETENKDKIIAAKAQEIAKLQRDLTLSNQSTKQSIVNSSTSSVKSTQMSQSTEKSDGLRAVVSNASSDRDQQSAASSSSASSLVSSIESEKQSVPVKRHASVERPKK